MDNKEYFIKVIQNNPGCLQEVFLLFDRGELEAGSDFLDDLLGLPEESRVRTAGRQLETKYSAEQLTYEATPYEYIRGFLRAVEISNKDVIYDLGSGYGRFVLYGALTRDETFKGIEILAERHLRASQIKKRLGISNCQFLVGNVTDFDISDGDIFFLFNPFSIPTLSAVGEKLKKIAARKPIKIITWGGTSNNYFGNQSWIRAVKSKELETFDRPLEYFEN